LPRSKQLNPSKRDQICDYRFRLLRWFVAASGDAVITLGARGIVGHAARLHGFGAALFDLRSKKKQVQKKTTPGKKPRENKGPEKNNAFGR
jgi:hypothetical protein